METPLLVSLDFSIAFNIIDHHILLNLHHTSFGICNSALDWLSSYLENRKQFVSLGTPALPLLLVQVAWHRNQSLGLYSFLCSPPLSPTLPQNIESANNTMLMMLNFIYQFPAIIHLNSMTLKTASFPYSPGFPIMVCTWIRKKTDAIVLGTYQSAKSLSNIFNIKIAGTSVALSDKVKLLGIMLDRHLTLDSHIVPFGTLSHQNAPPHKECYF